MGSEIRKTISFGKIPYDNPKRKSNEVTVDIVLREITTNTGHTYKELAISGDIWNSRHTDIVAGGQCLHLMADYIHTPLFNEILDIWHKWHLNGMNAGTPEQTEAVRVWREQGNDFDYDKTCEMLKSLGLLTVCFTGHGYEKDYDNEAYTYGTDWLIRELPEDVVKRITEIIEQN